MMPSPLLKIPSEFTSHIGLDTSKNSTTVSKLQPPLKRLILLFAILITLMDDLHLLTDTSHREIHGGILAVGLRPAGIDDFVVLAAGGYDGFDNFVYCTSAYRCSITALQHIAV